VDGDFAKCQLRRGLEIHLYISQPPCGDACIFPQQSTGLLSLPSSMFTCGVPGSVAGDTIQEASGSDNIAVNCQVQLRGGEHHQTAHSIVCSITFANIKQPGLSHKRSGFRI
jgi:hypothetical protein